MITPVSISLSREQKAWLDRRKQSGAFTNRSAVVQDLIRQAMGAEAAAEISAEPPEKPAKPARRRRR